MEIAQTLKATGSLLGLRRCRSSLTSLLKGPEALSLIRMLRGDDKWRTHV